MGDNKDPIPDLAKTFEEKLTLADRTDQTPRADTGQPAQTSLQPERANKRDVSDADDGEPVSPPQKRIRISSDTHHAQSAAQDNSDPFDNGISDADLNKLYDGLLKTNPEFAKRESEAEAKRMYDGISDADLNKLYDGLLKTDPGFAKREAEAESKRLDGGVSDADLNKLYDNLLKTNPDFARREAAALENARDRSSAIHDRADDRSRSSVRDI